jgi:hypothetical protein
MGILIGIGVILAVVAYIGFMVWLVPRNMQVSFLMLSILRLVIGALIGVSLGFGLLPAAAGLPLGLIAAAGIWYCAAFVRSRMGKWHRLARRYRRQGTFPGSRWRFKTAWLGTPGPRGLGHPLIAMQTWLILGADQGGLYLSHHLVGKPFHPAVYIPWEAIKVTRPVNVLSWFRNLYVDLSIGPDGIVLRLDRAFAARLLAQHGPSLAPLAEGWTARAVARIA